MLAPWCKNEKWTFWTDTSGKRFARVTGRERCPASLKANPLWWWRNDYEQSLAEAPWYEADKSQAQRERDWAFRNPLQNARLFVFGVADRNYTVDVLEGNPDPMVVQRDDVIGPDGKPEQGYQRTRLTLDDGAVQYFTSYCGSKITWQLGPQPSGFYGAKFNFHRS